MPALPPPPPPYPGRERVDAAASSDGRRRRRSSSPRPRARASSRSPSSSEDEHENGVTQAERILMELGFPNSGPRGITEITAVLRFHGLKISGLESKEEIYYNSLVQLEERITSLQDYKEKLLGRVSRLEEDNLTLRSDNSKLKNLAHHLKERVDKLEQDNFMLDLKVTQYGQQMDQLQGQVKSTITQMQTYDHNHHLLEDRVRVLESNENHYTSRWSHMENSIVQQHGKIIAIEQEMNSNVTHYGQQIQNPSEQAVQQLGIIVLDEVMALRRSEQLVIGLGDSCSKLVKSVIGQFQTNKDYHYLLENRVEVLESREQHNTSKLVQMENSFSHQHERITTVEQNIKSNVIQYGEVQNKENDVLMKSFQSLLTCMVPFILAFLLSMLSSQSGFGESEKDIVINISLVCGLPGVTAMVFAHLTHGSFWTSIVSSLTLYFIITLVHYAFIRLLPWSPWTKSRFYAAITLAAMFLLVVLGMIIIWGHFVKKPKFTRWISSYFSWIPGLHDG